MAVSEPEHTGPAGASVLRPPVLRALAGGSGQPDTVVSIQGFHLHYGGTHALRGIDLDVPRHNVFAIIGPSGCGKSTLLRSLNRMNDRTPGLQVEGRVLFEGRDVYGPGVDVVSLRRRVGMVFQRPTPFPMSIFDNVACGPRLHGITSSRPELERWVEESLHRAGLWDEVRDRLRRPAAELSGGQLQRLAIARALAVRPDVLLLDEPTSAVDPVGAAHIEDTLVQLSDRYTIVIVTHNMQQAARISHRTAFLLDGELVEEGATDQVFQRPADPRTEAYLTGRFG